jgi:hypothetical protein
LKASGEFCGFAMATVAYRTESNDMLTEGVDVELERNLVLDVGVNVVFKPGNTDTELATTLNYSF